MSKFKIGDVVECVNDLDHELILSVGEKYTVEDTTGGGFIKVLGRWWYITRFKLVEENKMQKQFTKNDLKDWMRVVTRNGNCYIVNTTKEIAIRNEGHIDFKLMDHELKDLSGHIEWDITEVYGQPKYHNCLLNPLSKGDLLWKREEPKVQSPEQIEAENITKEIESLKLRLEELSKKL